MKRTLLATLLVACGSAPPAPVATPVAPAPAAPAPAPALDGYWTGVVAGQLHVALRVNGTQAVLDSIDQGSKVPIEALKLDGAVVHFELPTIHGHYDGTLAGDKIDGTWTQAGRASPLAFARGTAPAAGDEPKPHPTFGLGAPLDVVVPKPPTMLRADGRSHLVYELDVTNFGSLPATLTRVDVKAGVRSLATFDRAALDGMTVLAGAMTPTAAIPAGGRATVFVWVSFEGAAPAKLDHELGVQFGDTDLAVPGPSLAIAATQPRVVAPPLKGANWLAGGAPSNTSAHRRALLPISGRARIAQRFAIDWVQLGDDGKTFTGDPASNASYHAYGQQALAVAAGTVVEIKDGVIENVPHNAPAVPITLDTIAGDHVVVDLGNGAYAMWAHLQPGSLKVRVGDRVKAGQLLGLVGNSGNSTEPHLHFQVMDAGSPVGSEGIPYAFPKFSAHLEGEPARARTNELPTENEIVTF